jgi:hypothetical protein
MRKRQSGRRFWSRALRDAHYLRGLMRRNHWRLEQLGEFPHIGRLGLVTDTCEWSVTGLPYIRRMKWSCSVSFTARKIVSAVREATAAPKPRPQSP